MSECHKLNIPSTQNLNQRFELGKQLRRDSQYEKALSLFNELLRELVEGEKLESSSMSKSSVTLEKFACFVEMGDNNRAEQYLQTFTQERGAAKLDPDSLFWMSIYHYNKDQNSESIELLEDMMVIADPSDTSMVSWIHHMLFKNYLDIKDIDKAKSNLEKGFVLDPEFRRSVNGQIWLGRMAQESKELHEAIRHFESCLAAPELSEKGQEEKIQIYDDLIWCYLNIGDTGKAEKHLAQLQIEFPKLIERLPFNFYFAQTIEDRKNYKDAILKYETIRDNPNSEIYGPCSSVKIADIHNTQGNYKQAKIELNKINLPILWNSSWQVEYHKSIGHAQYYLGEYNEARNQYSSVLKLDKKDNWTRFWLGSCLMKQHKFIYALLYLIPLLNKFSDSESKENLSNHIRKCLNGITLIPFLKTR